MSCLAAWLYIIYYGSILSTVAWYYLLLLCLAHCGLVLLATTLSCPLRLGIACMSTLLADYYKNYYKPALSSSPFLITSYI
jgi:hypothetical protein